MPPFISDSIRQVCPYNCGEGGVDVKPESVPSKTENTRSTSSLPGVDGDVQHSYELGEIVPGNRVRQDEETTQPRSKIRVVAVIAALFVICDSPLSVSFNSNLSFVPSIPMYPLPTLCNARADVLSFL
jgi:hypothetical protein